jgi:hypothetical protein
LQHSAIFFLVQVDALHQTYYLQAARLASFKRLRELQDNWQADHQKYLDWRKNTPERRQKLLVSIFFGHGASDGRASKTPKSHGEESPSKCSFSIVQANRQFDRRPNIWPKQTGFWRFS